MQLDLQAQSNAFVTSRSEDWFSTRPPNEDFAAIQRRPLPPLDFVRKLRRILKDQLEKGARSVADLRYKASYLPLYSLEFWEQMSIVHRGQVAWRDSALWVEHAKTSKRGFSALHMLEDASVVLLGLPWNTYMGYLGMYIYRDHLDGTWPFCPWLHASEPCEHIFAEARKMIKEFSALDFYLLIPKLRLRVREANLSSRSSDAKKRAGGYAHGYLESKGVKLPALCIFPDDHTIDEESACAFEEACSLFDLLGVVKSRSKPIGNSVS